MERRGLSLLQILAALLVSPGLKIVLYLLASCQVREAPASAADITVSTAATAAAVRSAVASAVSTTPSLQSNNSVDGVSQGTIRRQPKATTQPLISCVFR